MQCEFCANHEIEKRIIYRDEYVMAFPTNIPIVPGHVLLCPVRHVSTLEETAPEEREALFRLQSKLKSAMKTAFGAEGFNYAWNEGKAAGQHVSHYHMHMIPRKEGDAGIYQYDPRQFLYRPGSRATSPEDELDAVAQLVRTHL